MPEDVKQGTIFITLSFIIASIFGYGSQIIIARILGPSDYGLLGILMSNVSICLALGSGIPNALVRFIPKYEATNDKKMVYATIKSGIKLQIFLNLAFIVIVVSLSLILEDMLFNNMAILIAFLIIVTLGYFYGLCSGILQGLREQRLFAVMESSQPMLYFLLILVLLIGLKLGLKGAICAYILTLSLLFVLGAIITKSAIKIRLEKSQDNNINNLIKFALPSSAISIADSIAQRSAPIIVKALGTGEVDKLVGYIVVILSITGIFDKLVRVIFRAAAPHMSYWYEQGNIKSINLYILRMSITIISACVLSIIIAHFWAYQIIDAIYGDEYIPITKYIIPSIIAFSFIAIANMYKVIMYAIEKPIIYLYLTIGGLMIYISMSYIISRYTDVIMSVIFSFGLSNLLLIIGSMVFIKKSKILIHKKNEVYDEVL